MDGYPIVCREVHGLQLFETPNHNSKFQILNSKFYKVGYPKTCQEVHALLICSKHHNSKFQILSSEF